jgi:hypothetical protein
MALKKRVVVMGPDAERDADKVFVIEEMPAEQAELWAGRAILALTRAGVDVPPDILRQGIVGITTLMIRSLAGIQSQEAIELAREMFTCVKYRPDANNPDYTRAPQGTDIEEVKTRVLLRKEIIELHTGFSFADAQSKLTSAAAEETLPSKNTKTSRRSSGRSSRAA